MKKDDRTPVAQIIEGGRTDERGRHNLDLAPMRTERWASADEPLIFARAHRPCETESEMEIFPDLPGGYPVLEPRKLQENELLYESTISALHKNLQLIVVRLCLRSSRGSEKCPKQPWAITLFACTPSINRQRSLT